MKKRASRRRGEDLDVALIESALEQLLSEGYGNFTMEQVAERAGTSRTVLARRWSSREELVAAALTHYLHQNPIVIDDLGSFRSELATLLVQISERGAATVSTIFGLRDYFGATNSSLADLRSKLKSEDLLNAIFERAIERGEVSLSKLTGRVRMLPIDLVRHEVFMTGKQISKATAFEILDTIFLPLVAQAAPKRR